jgi:hypothetical protein
MEGHYNLQQDFFGFRTLVLQGKKLKMIRVKTRPFSSV